MCRSNACAAAGKLADRTGPLGGVDGPAHRRRASTCSAIPGPGWLGRRSGYGCTQITSTRAGRGPPVATNGGSLLARGVDPSPRRVGAVWRQPSCSPRRRPPAVNIMAAPVLRQCRPASSPWPATAGCTPPPAARCRLQVLQVAVAGERPAVDAARPAAPVAGLRAARTRVIGLGPAGALRPLSVPDPGGMLISPGRRVLRQPPGVTALACARLRPTQQAGANAKPEPHGAPTVLRGSGPAGQGLGPDPATRAGWPLLDRQRWRVRQPTRLIGTRWPLHPRRGTAAWHTQSAAVVVDETVPVDLARKR
jgi:hypothetical protein